MNTPAIPVIADSVVPDAERMEFLPAFFGESLMLYGEALVYKWMGRLAPQYAGGFWQFHTLSNGGYYMAPTQPERLRLVVAGNGFDGFMSADAAGIVATLFALGQLAATEAQPDRFIEQYHALREYVDGHPEAGFIWRAID
jgi:Antirestriction protein